MKKFTAKKIKVVDQAGVELTEVKFSHKDLAMNCLNTSNEGLSVNDMRQRFKVIDKIDSMQPGEVVDLEDSEFETLKTCVNSIDGKKQWTAVDREIIAFVDSINAD